MTQQEARYIVTHFPRLMTKDESMAKRHFLYSEKVGTREDYSSEYHYQRRVEFFSSKGVFTKDPQVLKLLAVGYEKFIENVATRIQIETPQQYRLNLCPKCNYLARTPYSRQCRACGHQWHSMVSAEIVYDSSFRIKSRPHLWIIASISKGNLEKGHFIDLTNSQLNLRPAILQIETVSFSRNGVRGSAPALGLKANDIEEAMIKAHLRRSQTLQVLNTLHK